MVDVRGDVLGPPHCTTPAAVKAKKKVPLRAMKTFIEKEDGSYNVFSLMIGWVGAQFVQHGLDNVSLLRNLQTVTRAANLIILYL